MAWAAWPQRSIGLKEEEEPEPAAPPIEQGAGARISRPVKKVSGRGRLLVVVDAGTGARAGCLGVRDLASPSVWAGVPAPAAPAPRACGHGVVAVWTERARPGGWRTESFRNRLPWRTDGPTCLAV
jgi:hypothetical protein